MAPATETMKDRILAAAIQVIRGRGIVAATTKEIARTAGVSEGSLYNHFDNKTALFAAALGEVAGTARAAMMEVVGSAGQNTVEANLTRLAARMVEFYGELLPMTGPVLADPDLIAWLRAGGPQAQGAPPVPAPPTVPGAPPAGTAPTAAPAAGTAPSASGSATPGAAPASGGGGQVAPPTAATGPVLGHAALISYLKAEQTGGRLAAEAEPAFIAAALLGGCQQHAFLTRLAGPETVAAMARLPEDPEEFAAGLVRAILAGNVQ
ncbi:TetR/AcrR family transcriptional regulator [Actinomadura barringtoniae]|uniref:TetR/AcrR family transcriptional regulator n=1 Tax=Actinomadura barringtoniae TaxID=1427535 RepID=A0A939T3V9_9ACTN|nr:TetR/AcrR family transcriptional regulator [Actinomadura barringtoniae]MBO2447294.1 TetR/AcrR family transcriptional regulator [Actinomadura barringtoniae]